MKNTIIKLLGGYTKEDYDNICIRFTKNYNNYEDIIDIHKEKNKKLNNKCVALYAKIRKAKLKAEEVKKSKLKNVCKGYYLTYIDDIVKTLECNGKPGRKKK